MATVRFTEKAAKDAKKIAKFFVPGPPVKKMAGKVTEGVLSELSHGGLGPFLQGQFRMALAGTERKKMKKAKKALRP